MKMVDFKHENLWEQWFREAFVVPEDDYITSYNTLWLSYYCIDGQVLQVNEKQEAELVKKIFQHVYGTLPHLENILFLFRGEAITNKLSLEHMRPALNNLFVQMEKKSETILQ
jgi:hypothetical protein